VNKTSSNRATISALIDPLETFAAFEIRSRRPSGNRDVIGGVVPTT
jgi:hypothetical protein